MVLLGSSQRCGTFSPSPPFFSEVPTAVEKGLNSFNSNRVVSVLSGGIILYDIIIIIHYY